jgi:hypothetical protein
MQQVIARKQGIVTQIMVITIQCPDCKGVCQNESGSTMIEPENEVVTCLNCHGKYAVPARAFQIRGERRK